MIQQENGKRKKWASGKHRHYRNKYRWPIHALKNV